MIFISSGNPQKKKLRRLLVFLAHKALSMRLFMISRLAFSKRKSGKNIMVISPSGRSRWRKEINIKFFWIDIRPGTIKMWRLCFMRLWYKPDVEISSIFSYLIKPQWHYGTEGYPEQNDSCHCNYIFVTNCNLCLSWSHETIRGIFISDSNGRAWLGAA